MLGALKLPIESFLLLPFGVAGGILPIFHAKYSSFSRNAGAHKPGSFPSPGESLEVQAVIARWLRVDRNLHGCQKEPPASLRGQVGLKTNPALYFLFFFWCAGVNFHPDLAVSSHGCVDSRGGFSDLGLGCSSHRCDPRQIQVGYKGKHHAGGSWMGACPLCHVEPTEDAFTALQTRVGTQGRSLPTRHCLGCHF